jgi:hypothetical protein
MDVAAGSGVRVGHVLLFPCGMGDSVRWHFFNKELPHSFFSWQSRGPTMICLVTTVIVGNKLVP